MEPCVWCDWPRIRRNGDHAPWCPAVNAESYLLRLKRASNAALQTRPRIHSVERVYISKTTGVRRCRTCKIDGAKRRYAASKAVS